ncbi:MAG TPA: hypothetical protein V6D19_08000 [Stenomitos sp.]
MTPIWLTNILRPDEAVEALDLGEPELGADSSAAVWRKWLADKAIGEPKPLEGFTVEDLKAQGYVGVYKYVLAG